MSESMQIVTAVLGFLTLVFNGVMAYLVMRLRVKTSEVSDKVDTVETFAAVAAETATTAARAASGQLDKIEQLANGNMEALQRRYDELLRRHEALLLATPSPTKES